MKEQEPNQTQSTNSNFNLDFNRGPIDINENLQEPAERKTCLHQNHAGHASNPAIRRCFSCGFQWEDKEFCFDGSESPEGEEPQIAPSFARESREDYSFVQADSQYSITGASKRSAMALEALKTVNGHLEGYVEAVKTPTSPKVSQFLAVSLDVPTLPTINLLLSTQN